MLSYAKHSSHNLCRPVKSILWFQFAWQFYCKVKWLCMRETRQIQTCTEYTHGNRRNNGVHIWKQRKWWCTHMETEEMKVYTRNDVHTWKQWKWRCTHNRPMTPTSVQLHERKNWAHLHNTQIIAADRVRKKNQRHTTHNTPMIPTCIGALSHGILWKHAQQI